MNKHFLIAGILVLLIGIVGLSGDTKRVYCSTQPQSGNKIELQWEYRIISVSEW